MALNENEVLLSEAIKSMLQQDAQLGLSMHKDDPYGDEEERGLEYLHGNIQDMFHLKSAELVMANSVNQAFHKVHSYKYIDDPAFKTAMEKEMVAQAVPADQREKAKKFVDDIIKELSDEEAWAEKDSGFNPDLEEIMKIPENEQEFEILTDED